MRKTVVIVMILLHPLLVYGQGGSPVNTLLEVIGVLSPEDLSVDEYARFDELARHPVNINTASSSRLMSSGLFTAYQLAALEDYRQRHGAVLSVTELAAVDGFSYRYAKALSPFISFDATGIRRDDNTGIYADVDLKTSVRDTKDEKEKWNYSLRTRIEWNASLEASFACSRPYDSGQLHPSLFSACLTWHNSRGKVLAGDFNARFGQGLCLWNTATFASLSAPSSFMKKASGLSSSFSYTGSYAMTGVASDISLGSWRLSALLSFPDIKSRRLDEVKVLPAVNILRYFKSGHLAATHIMSVSDISDRDFRIPEMKSSVDAALCLGGVNVFSELAFDWVQSDLQVLAGAQAQIGELLEMASIVRYLPSSDEHAFALSGEFQKNNHHGVLFMELSYRPDKASDAGMLPLQHKSQLKWHWNIGGPFHLEVRLTERLRTWERKCKVDCRMDVSYDNDRWLAVARANVLAFRKVGLLGYVEAGYRLDKRLKLYLRQGIFGIDEWDDRIYVYERDVPGNFNVPAFYGRGIWTSAYLSSRFAQWGSTCLRLSYTSYSLMREKKKPGRAELVFQLSLHF